MSTPGATAELPAPPQRRRPWWPTVLGVVVGFATLTGAGRDLSTRFLHSLRIAKPAPVGVSVSAVSGGASRELLSVVAEMVADSGGSQPDPVNRSVPSLLAATRRVGTPVFALGARRDPPRVIFTDGRTLTWMVNRARLGTMLSEAGESRDLSASLDGAPVRVTVPVSVRVEYGHCPTPVSPTLQSQLQGPPPLPPDVADCVILTETRPPAVDAPAGVGLPELVRTALELSGLSPMQAAAFLDRVDWRATLAMSVPRFLRSLDSVDVRGAPGMLLSTGGRRGPAYELVWVDHERFFTLTGYGSPSAAVPLASSLSAVPGAR